ncbi:MAG: hypothetical protein PHW82_16870 [Bacteroidales bacterium]|nr:hypothetical protein [Bacteroidales bacterium]
MSLNPFKWLKRAETIDAIIWDKNATEARRCKLSLTGEIARDIKTDRTYNRAACTPIPLREGSAFSNVSQVYHFDEETGAGIRFEKGNDLITLRTNPDTLHQVLDTTLLAQLFGVEPSFKMILMGFVIGFLLAGTVFGLFG